MVHYRKSRYFWVSGMINESIGVSSFTTGKSEYHGLEGTWRDAEDGNLEENPIEQGSIDSTISFNVDVKANGESVLYVWICAGKDLRIVRNIHKVILHEQPEKLMRNTINYWISWVNKEYQKKLYVKPELLKQYKQSLLIIRTQIDNRGAILAANDSDIMKFNKDTYSYMWPRDGAWVALTLDKAGYSEITKRFFRFCADVMTKDGYLLHKYNPDKSVGSTNSIPCLCKLDNSAKTSVVDNSFNLVILFSASFFIDFFTFFIFFTFFFLGFSTSTLSSLTSTIYPFGPGLINVVPFTTSITSAVSCK